MDWYYVAVLEEHKGLLAKSTIFFTEYEANQELEDFFALYPNHINMVINGRRHEILRTYRP